MKYPPKSTFLQHLAQKNRLHRCGFDRFVFFRGMLFGSEKKWWGKKGHRTSSHEGLDLCFFVSSNQQYFRLDETVSVPMIYDGWVVHMTDDFLGKTVITRHCFDHPGQPELLSLYGHLNPDKDLQVGDEIKAGQIFAKISGFKNRPSVLLLPHLHISLAKPGLLPPAHLLEWEFLNTVDRSVFVDPLEAITTNYDIMEYDDAMDVPSIFPRYCQSDFVV